MSVPCLYLRCFSCSSHDEQRVWFLLLWKHPCLSPLFAHSFSPPVYCKKKQIPSFPGIFQRVCSSAISTFGSPLQYWLHFCSPRGIQIMALQWRILHIISPSWLHSSNAHLIHIKWDKGLLAHREHRALISFHLACSHKTTFSDELLLDSFKMYGLPNVFKWLFGPHHQPEKANTICPIYLNRDGRELGGEGGI